jgi:N-methylhydantoinase A/oxoprolinase/acetone carboxylase beta subunit
MGNLALGIDTGGTFTDGVIFDLDTAKIVHKTKVETTRHDLAAAVGLCVSNLLEMGKNQFELRSIKMVCLSTTLATNAIVENQGAEVGAVLIGFEPKELLPTPHIHTVAGGCNVKGEFRQALDRQAIEEAVNSLQSKVDAFAVSGYLSIRNPRQELEAAEIIRSITGCPVVCAHELSGDLGFYERTVTAVLNARLLPLITDLVDAVCKIIADKGIKAPLMVVRGDGSLISEAQARERPVETLLSGPAASIAGGMVLTGLRDGIVVDIGGTTTDVAVFQDGKCRINPKGAKVGGWLTRVKAADITTIGLGGDSLIGVSGVGMLKIGPQRVFPLSWAVSQHPSLLGELKDIFKSRFSPVNTEPTTLFFYVKDPSHMQLTASENTILNLIREKPISLYKLSRELDKHPDLLPWQRLVIVGSLHRASFTPTDILHFTENLALWDADAAQIGAAILARRYGTDLDVFITDALDAVYTKGATVILEALLGEQGEDTVLREKGSRFFLKEMLGSRGDGEKKLVEFSTKVNLPIVTVGAPAAAFGPPLSEKLAADIHLPEAAEVANAVGTVCGQVLEIALVTVKPGAGGGFLVHAPRSKDGFSEYEDAVAYALKLGEEHAYGQAVLSGATDIEISVRRQDRYSRISGKDDDSDDLRAKVFIETLIWVEAAGLPWSR